MGNTASSPAPQELKEIVPITRDLSDIRAIYMLEGAEELTKEERLRLCQSEDSPLIRAIFSDHHSHIDYLNRCWDLNPFIRDGAVPFDDALELLIKDFTPQERISLMMQETYFHRDYLDEFPDKHYPLHYAISCKYVKAIQLLVDGLSVEERLKVYSQLHDGRISSTTTALIETLHYQRQQFRTPESFLSDEEIEEIYDQQITMRDSFYKQNELTHALFYGMTHAEKYELLDKLMYQDGIAYLVSSGNGETQIKSVKTIYILVLCNFFRDEPFKYYGERLKIYPHSVTLKGLFNKEMGVHYRGEGLNLKQILRESLNKIGVLAVGLSSHFCWANGFGVALANGVSAKVFTKEERLQFFIQKNYRPMVDVIKNFSRAAHARGFQYVFLDPDLNLWFEGFSLEERQRALTDIKTENILELNLDDYMDAGRARIWLKSQIDPNKPPIVPSAENNATTNPIIYSNGHANSNNSPTESQTETTPELFSWFSTGAVFSQWKSRNRNTLTPRDISIKFGNN